MALKARMRLYSSAKISRFVNSNKNIPMGVLAGKAKLLEIVMFGTSTAALTEIDPGDAKMQITTADLMEYVSSDNLDKDILASGAVRAFNAIVVDANNEPKNKELRMAALGTTLVHTDETLLDCWHINAIDWGGADLDAAGNITIKKEDATTISTIALTANEGNGSGFKIPIGWKAVLLEGRLEADGVQAANEGKVLTMIVNDAIDLVTDVRVANLFTWTIYGTVLSIKVDLNRVFQAGTEITFWIQRANAANETFTSRLYFLLWEA